MNYKVAGMWYSSELYHHGIKGQKWGIQNGPPYPIEDPRIKGKMLDRIETETKSGVKVTMSQNPSSRLAGFMAKHFPSIREEQLKDKYFNITVDGKRIGEAEIFKESEDSLNVVWIGIRDDQRGRGYASAVMKSLVDFGKKEKFKQMTLEVPGDSPDARHIYEKLGFKDDRSLSEDDVWGGLTKMKLVF